MLLPEREFLDARNGGYYVAKSRISLESIAYAVRRGESVDEILADFPLLPSREAVESVVAFIRSHSTHIDAYLAEAEQLWEEARNLEAERIARIKAEKGMKPA